jgi:cellulose synthase/poly-beta-1,6-N-acetylglucosamine synthase-like glycosyltransferase
VERSLSVLLPVRNVQSILAATVAELLEIVGDLTRDFEVLILDDGSIDATIEVADELGVMYPQVVTQRHAAPLGRTASLQSGLARTSGDTLLLYGTGFGLPLDEICRLWRAIHEHEVVLGRLQSTSDRGGPGGIQMVSRRIAKPLLERLESRARLLAWLAERGISWCEIEFRGNLWPGTDALAASAGASAKPPHLSSPPRRSDGLKRPNYLTRHNDFALPD